MKPLPEDLLALGRLRKKEDILKRRQKQATLDRARFEQDLYERMVNEGWTPNDSGVRLGGVSYAPQRTDYAVVQDQAEFEEYALANDPSLLEQKVRKAELNRVVREKLDNNEPMPPGLGYYTKTYVSTKGASKSEKEDSHDDG